MKKLSNSHKSQIPVRLDPEDRDRLKRYLDSTYKGAMSDFLRRCAFEKVAAWEALQRDEQRKEEEHKAKLAQMGAAS